MLLKLSLLCVLAIVFLLLVKVVSNYFNLNKYKYFLIFFVALGLLSFYFIWPQNPQELSVAFVFNYLTLLLIGLG